MTITYSPEDDTLRILFRNAPIHESEVHPSGLILDFDQHGGILGLELAAASEHISGAEILSAMTVVRPDDRPSPLAAPRGDSSDSLRDSSDSLRLPATAIP